MVAEAKASYAVTDWALLAVATIARLVHWVVLSIVAILLAALLFENSAMARQYYPPLTASVQKARALVMSTLGERVRRTIPTRLGGRDGTDWLLIGLSVLVSAGAGRVEDSARRRVFERQMRVKVATLFADTGLKEGSRATQELEKKIKALKRGGKTDRKALLELFAETKRKLDGMGRELAFLSVDVVGSTAMKAQEHAPTVQLDFDEYRKLVERVFKANGVIKATWTPDGVMACFSDIDTAVKAGQGVIYALEHFNRDVKLMKAPFVVRCGVNAGFIYLDDDVPLEQVSDRVIDIAGHMQKYAEPNTVAVAKSIIKPLVDVTGFEHTEKIVDGLEVFSWRPQSRR